MVKKIVKTSLLSFSISLMTATSLQADSCYNDWIGECVPIPSDLYGVYDKNSCENDFSGTFYTSTDCTGDSSSGGDDGGAGDTGDSTTLSFGTIPTDVVVVEEASSSINLSSINFYYETPTSGVPVDVNNSKISMKLTVLSGKLEGVTANNITPSHCLHKQENDLCLYGNITDINDYLSTNTNITYVGNTNLSGDNSDTLYINAFDTAYQSAYVELGTSNIDITDVNDAPSFSNFSSTILSINEDAQVEITLAQLKAKGDESDIDGSVDTFVVQELTSGVLKIGTSSSTATAFVSGSNDSINSSNNAYWTPVSNVNGIINTFNLKAKDDDGLISSTSVQASIEVLAINDSPTVSSVSFSGDLKVGSTLTGTYTYSDIENDAESNSTFKWYRSDDVNGTTNKTEISNALSKSYTLTDQDANKYISFEVTPSDGKDAGLSIESTINSSKVFMNTPPSITSNPILNVETTNKYEYLLKGQDIDGDALTWSVKEDTTLPSWLSLNSSNNEVTTVAGNESAGSSDGQGNLASFSQPTGISLDDNGNIYVADSFGKYIRKIDSSGNVTTITNTNLNRVYGMAVDGNGNIYVSSYNEHKIVKIDSSGNITTVAGSGSSGDIDGQGTSAAFDNPRGIAVDGNGNIYVADTSNRKIRKIDSSGNVTTIAGSGNSGSIDGHGTSASFDEPTGLAIDDNGNIYVSDFRDHVIRKIDSSGNVTTLAGIVEYSAGSDGKGTSASFNFPNSLATDDNGNIYVVDFAAGKIRKIDSIGNVTTIAGNGSVGSTDGEGMSASFYAVNGISVDGNGNIYLADTNNHKIRKIGSETKLVGTPSNEHIGVDEVSITLSDENGGSVDQVFTINVAKANTAPIINIADSITTNEDENKALTFTYTDEDGDTVTAVEKTAPSNGNVSILDNTIIYAPYDDFNGNDSFILTLSDGAGFTQDYTISVEVNAVNDAPIVSSTPSSTVSNDTLYEYSFEGSDLEGDALKWEVTNNTQLPSWLELIYEEASVKTLVGSGEVGNTDASGSSASFSFPYAVASDNAGNTYVADTFNHKIRKIDNVGTVSTIDTSVDSFKLPHGIAVDNNGNIYVADTFNDVIKKIDSQNIVTTIDTSSSMLNKPHAIALDNSGNIYVSDTNNNQIKKINTSGDIEVLAPNEQFNYPKGIAVDESGNVYVSDTNNHQVKKIDTNGDVTVIGTNGSYPTGIYVDKENNVFVSNTSKHQILRIDSNGKVHTVAGTKFFGKTDGLGKIASFNFPSSISMDSNGSLIIADTYNHKIRKIPAPKLIGIKGTPSSNDVGTHNVSITLTDSNGNSTIQEFEISVEN